MESIVAARRISEAELIRPILVYLASQPNGFATTSDLITHLERQLQPSGEDLEILDGRSDTKFSQKVRNVVSHRNNPNGIVASGWAVYDEQREGLTITPLGRQHIAP